MKRFFVVFISIFLGVLIGGFISYVGINHFHPIADPRKFGEAVADLAFLFAVTGALDDMRRRAANGGRLKNHLPARQQATPSAVPDGQLAGERAAAGEIPHAEEIHLPDPLTDADEHPIVFRPYRKPMLIAALLLAGFGAFYTMVVGIREPVPFLQAVRIPGPSVVGISFAGAVLYFCLFIRSYLPNRAITVDTSGIILPRRRRLTWDQITEVELQGAGCIEFLGTVRIGLSDRRHIYVPWYQTGGEARRLYEVVHSCFAEHERRTQLECAVAVHGR